MHIFTQACVSVVSTPIFSCFMYLNCLLACCGMKGIINLTDSAFQLGNDIKLRKLNSKLVASITFLPSS